MPNITFGNTFTDGTALSATSLRQNIYRTTSPATGLSIVNGLLDEDNIDSSASLSPEHTQRGAFIDGSMRAATLNMDYFDEYFSNYTDTTWDSTNTPGERAIPGGCWSDWIPYDGKAWVQWQIMWGNQSTDATHRSRIYLKVNDTYQTNQRRAVGLSINSNAHEGYRRNRVWSGSTLVDVSEGRNHFGLYVICHSGINHTRVWARNISVVHWRETS